MSEAGSGDEWRSDNSPPPFAEKEMKIKKY